jgi:hypothetical protein
MSPHPEAAREAEALALILSSSKELAAELRQLGERLLRIELLVEKIALSMGIAPH